MPMEWFELIRSSEMEKWNFLDLQNFCPDSDLESSSFILVLSLKTALSMSPIISFLAHLQLVWNFLYKFEHVYFLSWLLRHHQLNFFCTGYFFLSISYGINVCNKRYFECLSSKKTLCHRVSYAWEIIWKSAPHLYLEEFYIPPWL